ncbi:MAG TPA: hypothetical protein DCZ10_06220 [Pelotomaculum sp.]|nr:hypothetical protein [Pelotomaculum sp.]
MKKPGFYCGLLDEPNEEENADDDDEEEKEAKVETKTAADSATDATTSTEGHCTTSLKTFFLYYEQWR